MRKISSVILAIFMCISAFCSLPTWAFAQEISEEDATSFSTVEYAVDTAYQITIPDYIIPADAGEERTGYNVSVSNATLPTSTQLNVSVEYSGNIKLREQNSVELKYNLYNGADAQTDHIVTYGEQILSINAGNAEETKTTVLSAELTEAPSYAGVYLDTATFSISAQKIRPEISQDEIDESPYLFGIGKTKPEYVIAEFNEDFTHVDIYKNGTASDGLSKDFVSPTADKTYPIYNNRATLKTVTVEEGVVGLGGNAFAMTNIESITFPNSLRSIGIGCFNGCKQLKGFLIPDGVTSIGKGAFQNCTAATSELHLPDALTELGVQAFYNCSKLTGSVIIPDGVTVIGQNAFANCSSLNGTITLNEGLKVIDPYAFSGCSKLTGSLIMPDTLEKIGAFAFQSMRGLNGTLTLNDGLLHIGDGAFNQCQNMTNTTLKIPASVETIGGDTIATVTATSASISIGSEPYLNSGTHVFYNFATSSLKEFDVPYNSASFKSVDGVLYTKDGSRLLAYPPSKEGTVFEIPEGVTQIDEMAFSRTSNGSANNKLQILVVPNSYVIQTTNQYKNVLNRANGNSLSVALYTHSTVNEIRVKDNNPNYTTIDGCLYSKDGSTLYYIPIAKSGSLRIANGTKTIMFGALYGFEKAAEHPNTGGCFTDLTELVIPKSVDSVSDITITRMNTFLAYGNSIVIEEGNTAIAMQNGKVVSIG